MFDPAIFDSAIFDTGDVTSPGGGGPKPHKPKPHKPPLGSRIMLSFDEGPEEDAAMLAILGSYPW
jgi:hypothetical protein